MLTLTIETDNAAFEDAPGAECARILRKLAATLADGASAGSGNLMDANGNRIGSWELS